MTDNLKPYLERMEINGCDEPLGEAYRIDGTNPDSNLRKDVNLDGISCCDYLVEYDGSHIVIEDTNIEAKIRDTKETYSSMIDDHGQQEELALHLIVLEIRLKVYGTMLVFCRVKKMPQHYLFWLVMTGNRSLDERVAENLRLRLKGVLKGAKLVNEVEVMSADIFQKLRGKQLAG